MKNELKQLAQTDDRTYSERAVVMRTYRTKDQLETFQQGLTTVQYDPVKHLTCDVRIVKDGTMVYGVKLTPHILQRDSSGNIIQTIYDGTVENPTGDVPVNIPLVGSYVFISWLDKHTAFVALQTNTENILVGSTEGAYFDFYNREDIRILELKNADEFNIQLNNGKLFSIKTDNKDFTTLLILLEKIVMSVEGAQIVLDKEPLGSSDIPVIKIETDGGKISIKNDVEDLRIILQDFVDSFISYINAVTVGLTTADPSLSSTLSNALSGLNQLKIRIDSLLM